MNPLRRTHHLLAPLLLVGVSTNVLYAQETVRSYELHILEMLSTQNPFGGWQSKWKELLPSFRLKDFTLHSERPITLEFPRTIEIVSVLGSPQISFFSFSPNGRVAVSPYWELVQEGSSYRVGYDDGVEWRLYDFIDRKSYRILYAGNYGPGINGLAWVTGNLFLAVGTIWDLTERNKDKVAPAIMLFDFESMKMRTLIGNYIEASVFYRNRPAGFSIETLLGR